MIVLPNDPCAALIPAQGLVFCNYPDSTVVVLLRTVVVLPRHRHCHGSSIAKSGSVPEMAGNMLSKHRMYSIISLSFMILPSISISILYCWLPMSSTNILIAAQETDGVMSRQMPTSEVLDAAFVKLPPEDLSHLSA